MKTRGWMVATIVLAVALAGPAVVPQVLANHPGELDAAAWAVALACTCLASACVFVSTSAWMPAVPTWCRMMAALCLAAWCPLATTSTAVAWRADLALAVLALAVAASGSARLAFRTVALVALTALACGLEATALVWPVGLLWSAWRWRRAWGLAWACMGVGVIAVVIAAVAVPPALSARRFVGAGYFIHRDAIVLLPVLLAGLAGCLGRRRHGAAVRAAGWFSSWAGASLVAWLMVVATAPLNVRLATLAFCWWMPAGLAELADLVAGPTVHPRTRVAPASRRCDFRVFGCTPNGSARIIRAVGACSLVALVALSLEGARLWYESVLLAVGAFIR